jgi:hypothetical protein
MPASSPGGRYRLSASEIESKLDQDESRVGVKFEAMKALRLRLKQK